MYEKFNLDFIIMMNSSARSKAKNMEEVREFTSLVYSFQCYI